MKKALICFTRVPRPGKTKTRLLGRLSPEQCARLHWAFLRDLAEVYLDIGIPLFVAYTEDPEWESLKDVFPAASFFPQKGRDLGEKMHNALNYVLNQGYGAVILTGADLPLMTRNHLLGGFEALKDADIALGPTFDGGYYLVGVKAPSPFLFQDQTYGYGNVFENTAAAAHAAGKTVACAPCCGDVDTPEDLDALEGRLESQSHTAAYLRALGEKI